jgi:hypothetical protein
MVCRVHISAGGAPLAGCTCGLPATFPLATILGWLPAYWPLADGFMISPLIPSVSKFPLRMFLPCATHRRSTGCCLAGTEYLGIQQGGVPCTVAA